MRRTPAETSSEANFDVGAAVVTPIGTNEVFASALLIATLAIIGSRILLLSSFRLYTKKPFDSLPEYWYTQIFLRLELFSFLQGYSTAIVVNTALTLPLTLLHDETRENRHGISNEHGGIHTHQKTDGRPKHPMPQTWHPLNKIQRRTWSDNRVHVETNSSLQMAQGFLSANVPIHF